MKSIVRFLIIIAFISCSKKKAIDFNINSSIGIGELYFDKINLVDNYKKPFKATYYIKNDTVYLVKNYPLSDTTIGIRLFSFNDNKVEKKLVKIEISGVSNPPFAYNYYITTQDTINEKERYIIKYIFGPDMEGRGQRDFGSELDSSCFVIKELEYVVDSGFTRINVFKYSDSCEYNFQTW